MPEFDDSMSPPHYRPQLEYSSITVIDRYTVLLKDGETTATIYPIHNPSELPPGLLAFLCDEFNMEIERGETYPFFDTLHIEAFQNYWFGSFAAVMVLGDSPNLEGARQWEKECLGTFYTKPNYPGRCSHICTAGFLVNAGIRGKGIGRTLTDCYLQWAPRLGYTYSVFNLVFESNVPARRIWESLNFKRIGRVKSAGILKGHETAVDALVYGRELINSSDPAVGGYRFDKIKFYLETGKYPAMADRSEKSRLRSSASHYRLVDGKLLLKGKEVISDPVRQLQICNEVHMTNHGGINKTTSVITEKYHWTRIKDTVAAAIKTCPECRESISDTSPTIKLRNQEPKKLSSGGIPAASSTGGLAGVLGSNRRKITSHSNRSNNYARNKSIGLDNGENSNSQNQGPHNTAHDMEAMVALHNLPNHRGDENLLNTHDLSGLDDGLIAVVEAAQKQQQQQQQQQQHQNHHQQQPQSRSHLHHHHHQQQQSHHHHSNHENAPSYAAVAAAAVSGDANQFSYPDYDDGTTDAYEDDHRNVNPHNDHGEHHHHHDEHEKLRTESISVAEFDHHVGAGGDEIEIARALMQSNQDTDGAGIGDDDDDNGNNHDHHHHHHSGEDSNLKNDHHSTSEDIYFKTN